MRVASLTLIAASVLLAANAAPLGQRGSVVSPIGESRVASPANISRAYPFVLRTRPRLRGESPHRRPQLSKERARGPTSPPWKRASPAADIDSDSSVGTDAPGWRAVRPTSVLERVAQPTPPPWKRESDSTTLRAKTDSLPFAADAPGWKKRATDVANADPSPAPSRSA
ncbi:hypothetical protein DFH06DRAFT_1124887 [Mycena polygramma]|nr:hypothetical protein DFH06DRAFT_1124887 [Mycena polygramma]